jgi:hypothetical protein
MFGFFKKRKASFAMRSSAEALVKIQFLISSEQPEDHVADSWALGYVFGALTAILQRMGMEPGPVAQPFLLEGFQAVFGGAGEKALSIALSRTRERDFAEAQLIGASEMLAAEPGKPAPFGLGVYLGSGKGMGSESRQEVIQHLRDRAMERMTPDAFRRALRAMTTA